MRCIDASAFECVGSNGVVSVMVVASDRLVSPELAEGDDIAQVKRCRRYGRGIGACGAVRAAHVNDDRPRAPDNTMPCSFPRACSKHQHRAAERPSREAQESHSYL